MTRRDFLLGATATVVGGGLARGSYINNATFLLPSVMTSDQEITCLLPDAAGIWVGTSGGVLRFDNAGLHRYTRADGLPAHEVRALVPTPDGIRAFFATGAADWGGSNWTAVSVPAPAPVPTPPMPPGATGTHVSAFTTTDSEGTLLATWGDTHLFRRAPGASVWRAEPSGLPPDVARQITAVAERDKVLWVGTRRAGLWRCDGNLWQCLTPVGAAPRNHNAQALCRFGGKFWVSTLDDGLMVYDGQHWRALAPPVVSSTAPRQMVGFQGRLYVRHGGGAIDCWDGSTWTKDVFRSALPRRQASALAVGGGKLVVGVWGGFSIWDGRRWAHHVNAPDLAGVPIACAAFSPDGKTLWIGTQGRGLCEADAQTGTVRRFHDERVSLPDDWVTEVVEDASGRLYAGTFVGGLAVREPGAQRFTTATTTEGENITGIVPHANGAWAATRHGVRAYMIDGTPSSTLSPLITGVDVEVQCLLADGNRLLVGTRTGIYSVPQPARL